MNSKNSQVKPVLWKVQVWIHRCPLESGECEVLLLQTTAERGKLWQPVTGWVDPSEPLAKAAQREAEEETGWRFEGEPHALNLEFDFTGRWGPAREAVFELRAPAAANVSAFSPVLDPSEHMDWKWVDATRALAWVPHESQRQALECLIAKFS